MSLAVTEDNKTITSSHWPQWLMIAALVYLLLVAMATICSDFKAAAGDQAKELFTFVSNPITAVIIGTVPQHSFNRPAPSLPSSWAWSRAAYRSLSPSPTNTIVSLGHVLRGEKFRRAFATATVHDFFNLFSIVIFLPLESV